MKARRSALVYAVVVVASSGGAIGSAFADALLAAALLATSGIAPVLWVISPVRVRDRRAAPHPAEVVFDLMLHRARSMKSADAGVTS